MDANETFYFIVFILCVPMLIWGINELISQNPAVQKRRENQKFERVLKEHREKRDRQNS